MTSPESFIHPTEARLPESFVRSLFDARLLPADFAFRTHWLPAALFDRGAYSKQPSASEVVTQDILSRTGHMPPTKLYDMYLGPTAVPPACIRISHRYDLRAITATSDKNWHMYTEYKHVLEDSRVRYAEKISHRTWLQLILASSHHNGTTLSWLEKANPGDLYKDTHDGVDMRRNIARTIIQDEELMYLADAPHVVPDTTVRIKKLSFNALHILLASKHPAEYGEELQAWRQAVDEGGKS